MYNFVIRTSNADVNLSFHMRLNCHCYRQHFKIKIKILSSSHQQFNWYQHFDFLLHVLVVTCCRLTLDSTRCHTQTIFESVNCASSFGSVTRLMMASVVLSSSSSGIMIRFSSSPVVESKWSQRIKNTDYLCLEFTDN